VRQWHRSWCHY